MSTSCCHCPVGSVVLAGLLPVSVLPFLGPLWPGLLPAVKLWFCPRQCLVKLLVQVLVLPLELFGF